MDMRKCKQCGRYTLKKRCQNCGSETVEPGPGKFSPEDRYGDYRRKEKLKDKK
ncbi:MAG: RNA-protein complex protein Nop10 [Candidatus Aenigmatarchaeota archaeon]